MPDDSYLDLKYFIDGAVYNCPFCNRRHVVYTPVTGMPFDWTNKKKAHATFVECNSCGKRSMHLSYTPLVQKGPYAKYGLAMVKGDLDSHIFFSAPTSFAVLDERMPPVIRELISEGESSLKLNLLTGASACIRKAIYELLEHEKVPGDNYEDGIKALKTKYPGADPTGIDVLSHIQDMTSDKVHEQSWPKWDANNLKLISESLKSVLHDLYVVPQERLERAQRIQQLQQQLIEDQRDRRQPTAPAEKLIPVKDGPN